jgi:SagB-type dehydrogenase family enzyme
MKTLYSLSRREILVLFTRLVLFLPFSTLFSARFVCAMNIKDKNQLRGYQMNLPKPKIKGDISLEGAIRSRRTIRSFKEDRLTIEQFSQILWAGQGITEERGYKRSAPSGGALYPMDIYAVIGKNGVAGITPGIYHYEPNQHTVSIITEGDLLHDVARAALSQMWMATASINLVITAEYNRICSKYGERGVRYAVIEAGHISQNIFLQAEAIGLGAGIVGAFYDETIVQVMKIPISHEPLLIMPVGYKG